MLKLGLSVNGKDGKEIDRAGLTKMKAAGIDAIEISLGREATAALDYDLLRSDADAVGIELWSLHLPFMPFEEIDISATDESLRRSSVDESADVIRRGIAIGIRRFVVHPSGEPSDEADRSARMASARLSLAELASVAAEGDATLCVENLPRTCLGRDSSDILALLSADARLRVCFDTNHLLEEDAIDFIRAVGNKISTIHVSDYDRLNERHWLAGEGCVDWPSLYSALLSTGYSGAWLYEVNLQAPPSITRAGDLTFGDFAHNASEIFSGKRPTPLGTPNEGLASWK